MMCYFGWPMVRDVGATLLRAATWEEIRTHGLTFGAVLER
jgi:hypothetical protein